MEAFEKRDGRKGGFVGSAGLTAGKVVEGKGVAMDDNE